MRTDLTGHAIARDPILAPELEERVLEKLGFSARPANDLAGLNAL
jgi:hypothetical protein